MNLLRSTEVTETKDSYANWADMRCGAPIYTRACKGLARTEETSTPFCTMSPKKVLVDFDASKSSQDKESEANKPGLTARQALLARLPSERANQKPRTANSSTRLATGSWKSRSKNSLLVKEISQGPLPEM